MDLYEHSTNDATSCVLLPIRISNFLHIFVLHDSSKIKWPIILILTELFGDHQPWGYYVVAGILFGLVYGAFSYLQEKRKKGKDE